MVQAKDNALQMMMAIISFVVINILLSLSIMFKLSTEIASRKKLFTSLERIGYMEASQKKIINHEIIGFYGFLIISTILYICAIFISLTIHHILDQSFCFILMILYIVPILLCSIINNLYYKKQVL